MNTFSGEPMYGILDRPWEYKVIALHYNRDEQEGTVELVLRKANSLHRLFFDGVVDLEIEKGFPTATSGLAIYDVRGRGLDGIGVRVACFEQGPGRISFYARTVRELQGPEV